VHWRCFSNTPSHWALPMNQVLPTAVLVQAWCKQIPPFGRVWHWMGAKLLMPLHVPLIYYLQGAECANDCSMPPGLPKQWTYPIICNTECKSQSNAGCNSSWYQVQGLISSSLNLVFQFDDVESKIFMSNLLYVCLTGIRITTVAFIYLLSTCIITLPLLSS
jgi:hypothetical protein